MMYSRMRADTFLQPTNYISGMQIYMYMYAYTFEYIYMYMYIDICRVDIDRYSLYIDICLYQSIQSVSIDIVSIDTVDIDIHTFEYMYISICRYRHVY